MLDMTIPASNGEPEAKVTLELPAGFKWTNEKTAGFSGPRVTEVEGAYLKRCYDNNKSFKLWALIETTMVQGMKQNRIEKIFRDNATKDW
jgi:hypothetical protein